MKTELILRDMFTPGKATCIVGGQWGSESKGSAIAWLASKLSETERVYDFVTCNSGSQAGHTSIHKAKKRVAFHMPTAPLIYQDELGSYDGTVYLNGGSIIDPGALEQELADLGFKGSLAIHPLAAVITDECKAEERKAGSVQTKIASTRKGVGVALSRKVARSGVVAKDHPYLKQFVRRIDLNYELRQHKTALVEIPQGVSLSLNHADFYPYCTSRDCTPADALSNAGIHPSFADATLVVLRTYPIRVGNIVEGEKTLGTSGGAYPGQRETSWEEIGVASEITTVTKRVRRVFEFSQQQLRETFSLCRPDAVFLTFCNYIKDQSYLDMIESSIYTVSKELWMPPPRVMYQWGPTTDDVGEEYTIGKKVAVA